MTSDITIIVSPVSACLGEFVFLQFMLVGVQIGFVSPQVPSLLGRLFSFAPLKNLKNNYKINSIYLFDYTTLDPLTAPQDPLIALVPPSVAGPAFRV